ncbi:MAG: ABC transporter ATP-binding protein [Sphingobacteriia bacterium]|nr:ABC transporter ATP-binding protein [Sphingobacteriia bacterium]NCC40271.1 ABC transporter ATP-binding protein [Gammaproteobacteria bacterium]
MIQLDRVDKVYNQGRHNEVWAVRDVSLELATRGITVIKGPSGSGKTSLLAMIGCLARPTRGRIHLDGQLLSGLPERFMTRVRRATFGFIFQRFNLIRGLTLIENVMLPAYPLAPDPRELHERAMRLLRQFRLQARANNKAEWLSGGEAQRAAICRALINQPRILIADEPTANLDSHLASELMELITQLAERGSGILISSHDPLVFEHERVARVVQLRDGRVCD